MVLSFSLWLGDLFKLHHKEAVRFAGRLVGNRENGEEIVQDAWLKLCARTKTSSILNPKSYLFKATRNAAIDFALREQREWKFRVDTSALSEADFADDAAKRYEERHQLAILAISLNELPAACRKAFVMSRLEGRTHLEIATHLNISVSMVEKHMVRALLHCRNLICEHHES